MYTQFPYEHLTKLGTQLETLSEDLKKDHHGAQDVEGLDPEDQANIKAAAQGFQDEWYTSLLELENNVGNLGTLTKKIGQLVGNTDSGLASEFGTQ